jgi:hypothetical protein
MENSWWQTLLTLLRVILISLRILGDDSHMQLMFAHCDTSEVQMSLNSQIKFTAQQTYENAYKEMFKNKIFYS